MILDQEISHYKSAIHNQADTGTTGGARSATKVTNFAVGEILPRLVALTSGTLDSADVQKQYQQGYLGNDNTVSYGYNGLIYLANCIKAPSAAGVAKLSGHLLDGGIVKICLWGINANSGLLDYEELTHLGTTLVTGAKPWTRILRAAARKVSDGTPTVVSGDNSVLGTYLGQGAGNEQVGLIPKGFGWATNELKIWLPSATDSIVTSANRRTPPTGFSGSQANSRASAIPVRNDANNSTVGPQVYQAYWVEQSLQPGMSPMDWIDFVPVLELDSGE